MSVKAKLIFVVLAILVSLITIAGKHHPIKDQIIYSLGEILLVGLLYLIIEVGFFKDDKNA